MEMPLDNWQIGETNMEVPRHWRLKDQRYRLEGSICPTCGQLNFPPRPVCSHNTALPVGIARSGLAAVPELKLVVDTVLSKG